MPAEFLPLNLIGKLTVEINQLLVDYLQCLIIQQSITQAEDYPPEHVNLGCIIICDWVI